jgi:hypothetical protein
MSAAAALVAGLLFIGAGWLLAVPPASPSASPSQSATHSRGVVLLEEADRRLAEAATVAETADWLRSQEQVVEVQADRDALRFRLDGGRPMWVLSAEAVAPRPSARLAAWRPPPAPLDGPNPATPVNPGSPQKRALVLSPWKFDFGAEDDGAIVAGTLAQTRGYEGGVTYRENATPTSGEVGVASFTGWDAFDVVHVVSHGTTVCDGSACHAMVMIPPKLSPVPDASELDQANLELASYLGDQYLALGADFFSAHYPGGLDNSVVFMNACETLTGGASDLAAALAGSTSVFFGWSDAVYGPSASSAAFALYGELSKGRVTAKAHEALGDKAQSAWVTPGGQQVNATLLRAGRTLDGDLRIRETVVLLDPETGVELVDGTEVEVIGEAEDGQPDAIQTTVQVDGIEPGDEPSYQVQLRVDEAGDDSFALTAGAAGDSGVVVVSRQLDLGRDVKDGEEVDLEARVLLPDTGFTEDRAHVVLDASPEFEWVGTATAVSNFSGQIQAIEADVTFVFRDEPTPGVERYLAQGELTWTVSGGSGDCTYSAGPVTVPIDAAPDSDDGNLQVDWNQEPGVYFASGTVEGDEVDVASTCGTVSMPAGGPWLYMTSPLPVVAEGTVIEGTSTNGLTEFTWYFERRRVG